MKLRINKKQSSCGSRPKAWALLRNWRHTWCAALSLSHSYRDGEDEVVGPRGVDLVLGEVVEEGLHDGFLPLVVCSPLWRA